MRHLLAPFQFPEPICRSASKSLWVWRLALGTFRTDMCMPKFQSASFEAEGWLCLALFRSILVKRTLVGHIWTILDQH